MGYVGERVVLLTKNVQTSTTKGYEVAVGVSRSGKITHSKRSDKRSGTEHGQVIKLLAFIAF